MDRAEGTRAATTRNLLAALIAAFTYAQVYGKYTGSITVRLRGSDEGSTDGTGARRESRPHRAMTQGSGQQPLVSVVVPVYNRPDLVCAAIDSVLGQTYDRVELIVVDDGSTDETVDVIQSEYPTVRLIEHDEQHGGSAARNSGIEEASGKYVAFLDSDDTWAPSKLERQVNRLESESTDIVAAYCDYHTDKSNPLVQAVSDMVRRPRGQEGGAELIPLVMTRRLDLGGASTLIANSELVRAIGGFDESFPRHQDLEFVIRLLERGELVFVDEPLVRRGETPDPGLDEIEIASELFLDTFSEHVESSASMGYDAYGVQQYFLAVEHLRRGSFRTGLTRLVRATVPTRRDWLSLGHAVIGGARRALRG